MADGDFSFEVTAHDLDGSARCGTLGTPHGMVQTPTFMPVGTLGTVKGLDMGRVAETGARIVLGNTYHLALRPGAETVARLGGLHRFAGWDGPMLTDSGGFQVFSLAEHAKVTEQGVAFRSHIDGSRWELTPESSMEIQRLLGADFVMAFDHVPALPNTREAVEEAMWR
ncbi:MAG: tRNA-guanine transglycosylase, partial [Planctomycetales bacterium]|nr:tRNA-guanine transglycosylase [Planctomycetales bacterium]